MRADDLWEFFFKNFGVSRENSTMHASLSFFVYEPIGREYITRVLSVPAEKIFGPNVIFGEVWASVTLLACPNYSL